MEPSKILARAIALTAILFAPSLRADVKLPAIFSDHLVLQAEAAVPVWGWADAGEEVTVSVAGQTAAAKAGDDGKWRATLKELKPGGPHQFVVKGKNSLIVDDVLVGEVWLGSGQSNMAMNVIASNDWEQERSAAIFPNLRMFTVESTAAREAQADCQGSWQVCSPQTVGHFSATAYFFGREVHKALGVPVGLINSSVGGTPIESWISPEAQNNSPKVKEFNEAQKKAAPPFNPELAKARYEKELAEWTAAAKKAKAEGQPVPRRPVDTIAQRERKGDLGGLFNGKIAPLVPYAIRGALWYQGEANSSGPKAAFYRVQLPLLIEDWRSRWGYEFPFAWVQLPNYEGSGRDWPVIRESMLKTLALPKTGMAIAIDVGDPKDIHPKNKQAVGQRLAKWALGDVYGKDVVTSGPLPAGHEVRGKEIVLSFKHAEGGLMAKGGELRGFTIAGADQQWKPAQARIEGNKVVVSSPEVPQPVAARYAWSNNPDCNLYNAAGLPASPFRTDEN